MDASVGFLLENLKQLVLYQADLIGNAKHNLDELNTDLVTFQAILLDASKMYKKDNIFLDMERQIREAVYDIEDTIDECVTEAAARRNERMVWFNKFFSIKDRALAKAVKTMLVDKVKPLMAKFQASRANFSIADGPDELEAYARSTRLERTTKIVGLEKEAESFVKTLTKEFDELQTSSIIGMPGLGKTTFAWKIFEDETIQHEFPVKIWVNVSENLNMRKVLLDILSNFTNTKPDEYVTEEELTREVHDYLVDVKFLLVMDDIWTIDSWKKLKALLPMNNRWGRVLITTRINEVGENVSKRQAYNLRLLTHTEGWELLRYKVFNGLDDVPTELVDVGKDIVTNCKGLPLSIVVIGGILERKTSIAVDNIAAKMKEWNEVYKRLKSYLVGGDDKDLLGSIISLSYNTLPYNMRNCFLYLGAFPEDADIHVKKLIRMWIAEGFVHERQGLTLEEVAHNNLKELINRNLVMVRKAKFDGEAKICHIHDSIREICKREGGYGKLNLFQEVSKSEPPRENIANYRRISFHLNDVDFFVKKPRPSLLKARSFLCFNESPMKLERREMAPVTDTFGLLRVYEAKNIIFPIFPVKLVKQLNHLRYITLAVVDTEFKALPEIVTKLWNLQTLIVETPSPTLDINGDLLKMSQLRHFKTRASIILKKIGEGAGSDKLQTLSRLSPESCTPEVCGKAKALLTLVIQGNLEKLEPSTSFRELESLNKLKLVHVVSRGGEAENPWKNIPGSLGFPLELKIVVLSGTHLDWSKMSIFSAIGSLEVLKLKENAFHGNAWEAVGSGFVHLVCLQIERADLNRWKASNEHFPELKVLYISNCPNLLAIPTTLGKKLERLYLEGVTKEAIDSANEIEQERKKQKGLFILKIAVADKKK